jgi:hypothetical protein
VIEERRNAAIEGGQTTYGRIRKATASERAEGQVAGLDLLGFLPEAVK